MVLDRPTAAAEGGTWQLITTCCPVAGCGYSMHPSWNTLFKGLAPENHDFHKVMQAHLLSQFFIIYHLPYLKTPSNKQKKGPYYHVIRMANQTVDGRTPAQPGMYKIPIKINGINYLSTRAEFQPSTVSKAWVLWRFDLGAVGFSWLCFLCLPKKASTHQGKPSFHGYIAVKEAGSIGKMPSQNHLCLGTIKDPAGHSECKIMHAENAQKLLVNRKSTKYSIIQYLIYQNLLSCCELPNCTKRVIKKLHILALSAPGYLPVYPYRVSHYRRAWDLSGLEIHVCYTPFKSHSSILQGS